MEIAILSPSTELCRALFWFSVRVGTLPNLHFIYLTFNLSYVNLNLLLFND